MTATYIHSPQPYTITGIARLLLLLLYSSFFFVQLFFNFDINQSARRLPFAACLEGKSGHTLVKKSSLPSEKKTIFRLNKRYQPQAVVNCCPVDIEPLICPVTSRLHIHYSGIIIPFDLPAAHALRGPPVVA